MLSSVAVIAVPGLAPFELGVACEVFGLDRRDTGGPAFDFRVCTPEPGLVRSKIGLEYAIQHGLETTEGADLVVMDAYDVTTRPDPRVFEALRAARERGAWVLSLCSGAYALGHAGLLDGRRCTTHWMYADDLARRFPLADVDPCALYVEDEGVITSAGTAAGIDACLHLVRRELGAVAAAAIAKRMVVPPHREGDQAQYVDTPVPVAASSLGAVLGWMVENLDADLGVPALARRALLSERTFARRFKAETGATPAAWVARQRLLRAQELLERTELPVEEVARRAGFGTAPVLRHHFSRSLSTTPQAYRRAFTCVDVGAGAS